MTFLNNIKIKLMDIETKRIFYKDFKSEFERDKFRRKLRYAKHIMEVKE